MQYNILADCYTDALHSSNLNQSHLDFKIRAPKICNEIRASKADIICLCEVDHYDDCYGPLLTEMGYKIHSVSRRGLDSVLIAYNPTKFEYVRHQTIQHDDLCDKFPPIKPGLANDFQRGNCAIVVVLKHLNSGKVL